MANKPVTKNNQIDKDQKEVFCQKKKAFENILVILFKEKF